MPHKQKDARFETGEYLRIVRKRLWLLIVVFVPVVTGAAIVSYRMTPVYRATALLQIEKTEPNIVAIQDVYQTDVRPDDFYQTQYRLITSRRVCRKVFDRLELALSERYAGNNDPVEALTNDMIIEPVRDTYLVNVSYESEDPQLAASVANAVSDEYVATMKQVKTTASGEAENRITEQIPILRTKLTKSQDALQKFEEENSAFSLEKRRAMIYQDFSSLSARITGVSQEIAAAKARYKSVAEAKTVDDILSLPEIVGNYAIQTHGEKKLEFEARKAGLLQQYRADSEQIKAIDNQIKAVEKRIQDDASKIAESIRTKLEEKNQERKELQALIDEQEKLARSIDTTMTKYDSLKAEVEGNRRLYEEFVQRQKELQSSSRFDLSTVQIVDRAEAPKIPVRPQKKLYIILSVFASILGGMGLAFLLEYLDNTIRRHEDIERYLDLPVLGMVDSANVNRKKFEEVDLQTHQKPKSNISEAFRSIRTNLLYTSPNQEAKAYVVTSAGPQEGKTTVAINLAIVLAHTGKKVLLVDSDLRKPRIHKTLKTDGARGLTNYLVGQDKAEDLIVETEIENLSFMPSGPVPPNPAELLGSAGMKKFLAEMKGVFSTVILDSPPLIAVTDATLLAAISDGAIQVIWAGNTSRKIAEMGKEKIEAVGARIVGAVLNNVKTTRSSYYYYHPRYYKYYSTQEKESSEEPVS
jgi:succinoglycan biosynthesis transport protein ExoP